MKAVCKKCNFEVSGESRDEIDSKFRGHSETFGHMEYYVSEYG